MDSDQVSFFREVVFNILGNATKVDFRDIDKVKPLFQMDSGRRLFSYFLKQALKTVSANDMSTMTRVKLFFSRVINERASAQ